MNVDQGWVPLLQAKLKQSKDHSEYIVHNESISGDTSAGGLARLDKALADHKPDFLLLELGANDGLRGLPPATLKANLTEITRRAQKSGAKVVLLGMKIPPNYGKRYIDALYQVFPDLAQELNIPLIPFILEEVALNPEMMQADGLHPNAKAQPVIADKIAVYLFPLL
jgi:acyl-CoA thioesterase-1